MPTRPLLEVLPREAVEAIRRSRRQRGRVAPSDKASITACVLWAEGGARARKEKRRFATLTSDLLQLADWLRACRVTHIAMEATGVLSLEWD